VAVAGWSAVGIKSHVETQQAQSTAVLSAPLAKARSIDKQKNELRKRGDKEQAEIRDIERIPGYRDVVPQVYYLVQNAAPSDWIQAAFKAAAPDIAKEKKKTVPEVTFSEVWARIGTNEFQKNPDNKVQLFLIDQIIPELWVGKPPEAAATGIPIGPPMSPASPPGGPGLGVPISGSTGAPAGGPITPGGLGGPTVAGGGASTGGVGAMAQQGGGDANNKGFRITMIWRSTRSILMRSMPGCRRAPGPLSTRS